MYRSNIHSEHGSSSNHSSRSGHHEWLSSIILSLSECARCFGDIVFNPLGGATRLLDATARSNGGASNSWICVDARAIQECSQGVSGGGITLSVFPSVSRNCSGCNSVCSSCCASIDHCLVIGLSSVVTLCRGLSNFLSSSTSGSVKFVRAREKVLENWACGVGSWGNIGACGCKQVILDTSSCASTNICSTSVACSINNGISNIWSSSGQASRITVHNFSPCCSNSCSASARSSSTISLVPSVERSVLLTSVGSIWCAFNEKISWD